MNFQIGATTGSESKIAITISSVDVSSLTSISDVAAATAAMSALDTAINTVSNSRADLGALQSRFEGVLSQLSAAKENTDAARSRIMDADYAGKPRVLSRAQILQQAGTAMLAQANALPQNVLTLATVIRGFSTEIDSSVRG